MLEREQREGERKGRERESFFFFSFL